MTSWTFTRAVQFLLGSLDSMESSIEVGSMLANLLSTSLVRFTYRATAHFDLIKDHRTHIHDKAEEYRRSILATSCQRNNVEVNLVVGMGNMFVPQRNGARTPEEAGMLGSIPIGPAWAWALIVLAYAGAFWLVWD